MKPEVRQGLDDAQRHLQIAQDLLDHENADDVAASRAYYAMFYAAEALPLSRGLSFGKHQGVISAFGMHFAKTRELPPQLHGYIAEAFRLRHVADYTRGMSVAPEDAANAVAQAAEFIDTIEGYLQQAQE